MNILNGIRRFFFQKASTDFDANEAFRRNQLRYNALRALDPDVLVRHLEAFQRGDICGLERVIDEFEQREDKMRIGSFKMAAAVSSKPWKVQIRQGEEENPRAKLHQEHLTKFWNRVEATDAFCRNRKGGLRLLVKQMMSAQSRVYSVHDICWKVNGDGTLNATFTHVPAWCFENRTGRLRYIRNDCDTVGAEMPDGEWLVTVGEGVGVAAAVIAMAKRLSWNDWLLFSEKCGMPVILGNTNAQRDTPAWAAMSRAIRAIAPKTGLLADTGTTLSAVPMGAGGQNTYRELVDTVDRAISALYRGGDLATQSSGPDAAGVNAQAGESELMDDDGCKMVAETLRDQVEKFVIRFELGDFEPLAEIVINPPADSDDVEREMKIDTHLSRLGVKLSKKDALARYGRTEAEDENDALTPPQTPPQGGFGGLANEKTGKTPLQTREEAFKNAPGDSDGQGDPSGLPPSQIAKKRPSGVEGVLEAFAKDTGAAAKAVEEFLKDPSKEAAEKLLADLPELMPDDPAMAAVIADAMAEAMGGKGGSLTQRRGEAEDAELANEITNPCPKCHRQMSADGTCTSCAKRAENMKKVAGLVDELAKKSPDGKKPGWAHKEETLGEVDAKTAAAISAAMPEINAEGQTFEVDTTQLQHALNDHGVGRETNENQIPITPDDLRKIPDVLSDYDEIVPGKGVKDGKKNNAVIFKKKFEDGTLACVEIDQYSEKRKSRILRFKTMWKEKIS